MNNDIDPKTAYYKTLKGIVITFVICNILIISAVAAGLYYIIKRIDETANNINSKIDKSYENTAELGRKLVDKMEKVGDGIEKSIRSDAREIKDKGRELIKGYIKSRSDKDELNDKTAQQGVAPEPVTHQ